MYSYIKSHLLLLTIITLSSWHIFHAGPFVYVGNNDDTTVSVIDAATNTVITTINIGARPNYNGLAITPNNTTVYVTCADNTVKLIDVAANTYLPLKDIPMGALPQSIAITHNGTYAYVSCKDNTVKRINIASNAIDTTITGFNNPFDIAIAPNDLTAYVGDKGANQIVPLDLAANTWGTPVLLPSPLGIAITPDNSYAYVVNGLGSGATFQSKIYQLNLSNRLSPFISNTQSLSRNTELARGVAIPLSGSTAYTCDYNGGRIEAINITNPASLSLGNITFATNEPWMIAFTPNQNIAYITDNSQNTVLVLDITTPLSPIIITEIPVGYAPTGIAITFGPAAPTHVVGTLKTINHQSQCNLVIKWRASSSSDVVSYTIYGDNSPIGSVSAHDRLRFKTVLYGSNCAKIFSVAAVDSNGVESYHVPATIA